LNTGDPFILPTTEWGYQINLTGFNSLKISLGEVGFRRKPFDALREMLHTYRTITLQALNIDLLDLWDAQWNWFANDYDQQLWIKDHNFFGERVLGLAPGSTQVLFLSIKSLSFSSVQFQDASLEIAHALDISRLHHLNLRNCRHTGPLFRKIVESAKPLNLRSLELVIPHHSDNSYAKEVDEDWIKPFLSSFEGLNSLNLLVLNGEGLRQLVGIGLRFSITRKRWHDSFITKYTLNSGWIETEICETIRF
jgi:hypothetical protein